MKIFVVCGRVVFLLLCVAISSRADFREFQSVPVNPELQAAVGKVAEATLQEFPRLTTEGLALSVIDLTSPETPLRADYRGDASFYPASVMKLFVMTQIFRESRHSPEIDRALREMIHVSDNDATAYLMDVLSGTTGGPELEGKALEEFIDRRRTTNRYFASLGYDISAMMKPWSFGPYGREMQLLGENKINRNRATANTFASLLYWIVRKRAVSPVASGQMLELLERPLENRRPDENQVNEFLGESLPVGTKLWSKAGDTSEVRHDAAYVELPSGKKFIIVVLTSGAADDKTLLPAIGKRLLAEIAP
ncbi:MAG: class A beta-lactamase-related serine hydrolase [Verrucomicrobiota bacterium]|nr:class A beta-lactamase-related serine hydrolase [Verrucomicrobiota bacterium]